MATYKSGVQCFKQFLLLNNIVSSVETLPKLSVGIFCSSLPTVIIRSAFSIVQLMFTSVEYEWNI